MMVLAIAVNLLPVFLTTIAVDWAAAHLFRPNSWGGSEPSLSPDWSAVILVTGPLADRWGAEYLPWAGMR